MDVDNVTLVLRSYPIRVAGDSGPLPGETNWSEIARRCGTTRDLSEFTTVTHNLRRVGEFDPQVVKAAIAANNPNCLIMNHVDYIGNKSQTYDNQSDVVHFVNRVEDMIGMEISYLGFSEKSLVRRNSASAKAPIVLSKN